MKFAIYHNNFLFYLATTRKIRPEGVCREKSQFIGIKKEYECVVFKNKRCPEIQRLINDKRQRFWKEFS